MNKATSKASRIIDAMMAKDYFSQWLAIERLEEEEGSCKLQMTVRPEMCNGFGIAHGGISFSFADSALAFASNSRGRYALSIETSISHLKKVYAGDRIVAIASEKNLTKNIGLYEVTVSREDGTLVAIFKGTVFIKEKEWEV